MASKVDIVNLALQRVKGTAVTSTTLAADDTSSAQLINRAYDLSVDEVIASGSWSAAIFEASLTQDSSTPNFTFAFQYHLPTDPFCLKVISLNGAEGDVNTKYRINGRFLKTDESTVDITYVGRLTDSESFGVFLQNAIISKLAVELVIPVTQSRTLYDDLLKKYKEIDLPENIMMDNQQGSHPTYRFNSRISDVRADG